MQLVECYGRNTAVFGIWWPMEYGGLWNTVASEIQGPMEYGGIGIRKPVEYGSWWITGTRGILPMEDGGLGNRGACGLWWPME